ncbi:5,6-dimethylbenzimidazole synthase [Thalassotalea insulae]|uniref:5,6-dimethylbenzimidazole synthase n=1 Tax=Thalassotalea insulae TaxID=2056778 RepID=A0ABQ6GQQ4_9GAMM|nr:5,6-dimethylbenzimidazole synthase [Thalassotalea insulae]GLX76907.1 5,6-dimethylbenzimidazole synthase [Thalassotalea insulae]
MKNKHFDQNAQQTLNNIIKLRRDIRGNNFLNTPIAEDVLEKILASASLAPSVGYSQPWEMVLITDQKIKQQIVANHQQENQRAKALFSDEKQQQYAQLKLEGIIEAPINIAVFYQPENGPVLGQHSMPEMGEYSVVCAIQNMWLTARAHNIGLGWVSILDPDVVKEILNAPATNKLIGYLCIGHVKEFLDRPELELINWRQKKTLAIYQNSY